MYFVVVFESLQDYVKGQTQGCFNEKRIDWIPKGVLFKQV